MLELKLWHVVVFTVCTFEIGFFIGLLFLRIEQKAKVQSSYATQQKGISADAAQFMMEGKL